MRTEVLSFDRRTTTARIVDPGSLRSVNPVSDKDETMNPMLVPDPQERAEVQPFQGRIKRVAAVAMILIPASIIYAQMPSTAPKTGLINTAGAAFNPATAKGYVVDSHAGVVHVINNRGGDAHAIRVGANPTSIAVDTENGRAYILNAGEGTVSVLDGQTDSLIATLPVGSTPYSIAADSVAGKIYVTRTYSDQLMIIDAATNHVSSIKAGSPDLVAVNQKTHTIYMLSYEMGDLLILDGATQHLARTSVGMHAWGMVLNPDTGALFVAKPGDGAVAVLAPGSITPSFIHIGGIPCAVAINPKTNIAYVANYTGNSVAVINAAEARIVATVPVGIRPEGVAVDPDHNQIFVANTLSHSVSIIDALTNKVIRTQPVNSSPYALAVDSVRRKLHVAELGAPAFATIDAP